MKTEVGHRSGVSTGEVQVVTDSSLSEVVSQTFYYRSSLFLSVSQGSLPWGLGTPEPSLLVYLPTIPTDLPPSLPWGRNPRVETLYTTIFRKGTFKVLLSFKLFRGYKQEGQDSRESEKSFLKVYNVYWPLLFYPFHLPYLSLLSGWKEISRNRPVLTSSLISIRSSLSLPDLRDVKRDRTIPCLKFRRFHPGTVRGRW